ncbi:MAG TPA: preprotein translocase subunit SecA, partial [Actinobacteria bacterium]|nr:preprotein translocase subunit SecA [Actinomycetota bacterium]
YEKLAGMTGTAKTEAGEFNEIYKLEVVEIPTNVAVARIDQPDLVYMTEDAKFNALTEDLVERHAKGQPVLVGTISIEKSERLSAALSKQGVPHEVLNAKHHEREATIIAQAGRVGAVTVATNMAGRGVDIRLGGNPDELAKLEMRKQGLEPGTPAYDVALAETLAVLKAETAAEASKVIEVGGLYVLATERHEARRIDNQLRGRSGRQGDPGESRFYLSLEDDLMRRFATDRVQSIMRRLRIPEDVPIEHGMVTKSIERAQRQVESQNFELRKNVLKYDEVMNRQRSVIYEWRNRVLTGGDTEELVREWIDDVVGDTIDEVITESVAPPDWDVAELERRLTLIYTSAQTVPAVLGGAKSPGEAAEAVTADAQDAYTKREEQFGPELMRRLERTVVLSIVDAKWREHLADMDYLRSGVGLRAMGQRDPLTEYQREAYDMFAEMVEAIKADSVRYLFHAQMVERQNRPDPVVQLQGTGGAALKRQASADGKVGRNDPCPCGSGKKYKKCHGAAVAAPLVES